tara:strand:- start:891 stop:1070 length:180 start_codon:yes stop_codon:yes gene_type:complete
MRVYKPKKHNGKIDEALTQLYLLKKALAVQNTDTLEKQVDKIREILNDLKEFLNQNDKE